MRGTNTIRAWCPKGKRGELWYEWLKRGRDQVTDQLDEKYEEWRQEGLKIVQIEIREVS